MMDSGNLWTACSKTKIVSRNFEHLTRNDDALLLEVDGPAARRKQQRFLAAAAVSKLKE